MLLSGNWLTAGCRLSRAAVFLSYSSTICRQKGVLLFITPRVLLLGCRYLLPHSLCTLILYLYWAKMRVQPPTIDQFPTFDQVRSWLEYDTRQCIWYLPNKGRCCWIQISDNHSDIAYRLMIRLLGASEEHFPSMSNALDLLQQIAEHSCCVQKHRNKITGSGLAQKLAIQWLTEMLVSEYGANSWELQRIRRRGELPYTLTTWIEPARVKLTPPPIL